MVHDEFIARLHDNFKKTYGLEIANIRVESFKIMNSELADNISKQAIITAQVLSLLPLTLPLFFASPLFISFSFSPHPHATFAFPLEIKRYYVACISLPLVITSL